MTVIWWASSDFRVLRAQTGHVDPGAPYTSIVESEWLVWEVRVRTNVGLDVVVVDDVRVIFLGYGMSIMALAPKIIPYVYSDIVWNVQYRKHFVMIQLFVVNV